MIVGADVVRAQLAAEIPAAASWATRHQGWAIRQLGDTFVAVVRGAHPAGRRLWLIGDFADYPAVPPAWVFSGRHGDRGRSAWPAGGPVDGGGSIFIEGSAGPVICAHFNRLAYSDHGGPHGDWGGTLNWRAVQTGGYATALTIGDMLAVIRRHVLASPGMQP